MISKEEISKEDLRWAKKFIISRRLPFDEQRKLRKVLCTDEFLHISDVLPVIEMLLNDELEEFRMDIEKHHYFETNESISPYNRIEKNKKCPKK